MLSLTDLPVYYLNLADTLQAAKTAVYVLLTLVGDAFVVIVFNYHTGAVVDYPHPGLPLVWYWNWWFGGTVAFSRAAPGAQVFLPAIVPWVTSFIAMTLATNIVCTCLIGFKAWRIRRNLRGAAIHGSVGQSTVIIIIESAVLYSSAILSLMITYQLGSNAQYTVLDLTAPLIGITFTIIILRVSMGISSRQLTTLNASGASSGLSARHGASGGASAHLRFRNASAPVTVNVSHFVEVDQYHELDPERSEVHKDPALIKEEMV